MILMTNNREFEQRHDELSVNVYNLERDSNRALRKRVFHSNSRNSASSIDSFREEQQDDVISLDYNSVLVQEHYMRLFLPQWRPVDYASSVVVDIKILERRAHNETNIMALLLFEDGDLASFEVERNYTSETDILDARKYKMGPFLPPEFDLIYKKES